MQRSNGTANGAEYASATSTNPASVPNGSTALYTSTGISTSTSNAPQQAARPTARTAQRGSRRIPRYPGGARDTEDEETLKRKKPATLSRSSTESSAKGRKVPPSKKARTTPAIPEPKPREIVVTSCITCRKRKLRCDAKHKGPDEPCNNCTKSGRKCEFPQGWINGAFFTRVTNQPLPGGSPQLASAPSVSGPPAPELNPTSDVSQWGLELALKIPLSKVPKVVEALIDHFFDQAGSAAASLNRDDVLRQWAALRPGAQTKPVQPIPTHLLLAIVAAAATLPCASSQQKLVTQHRDALLHWGPNAWYWARQAVTEQLATSPCALQAPLFHFSPELQTKGPELDVLQAHLIVGYYWCGSDPGSVSRITWLESLVSLTHDHLLLAPMTSATRIFYWTVHSLEKLTCLVTQRPARLALESMSPLTAMDICSIQGPKEGCQLHFERSEPHTITLHLLQQWVQLGTIIEQHQLNEFEADRQALHSTVEHTEDDEALDGVLVEYDRRQTSRTDALRSWITGLKTTVFTPLQIAHQRQSDGAQPTAIVYPPLLQELLQFFYMVQMVVFAPTLFLNSLRWAEATPPPSDFAGLDPTAVAGVLDSACYLTASHPDPDELSTEAQTPLDLGTGMGHAFWAWFESYSGTHDVMLDWTLWRSKRLVKLVARSEVSDHGEVVPRQPLNIERSKSVDEVEDDYDAEVSEVEVEKRVPKSASAPATPMHSKSFAAQQAATPGATFPPPPPPPAPVPTPTSVPRARPAPLQIGAPNVVAEAGTPGLLELNSARTDLFVPPSALLGYFEDTIQFPDPEGLAMGTPYPASGLPPTASTSSFLFS